MIKSGRLKIGPKMKWMMKKMRTREMRTEKMRARKMMRIRKAWKMRLV